MCVTSLQLSVTPSMVPLGRLLVFYVRDNGEGVADSLQFTVETFFENQVEHWDPNLGQGRGMGKHHPGLRFPGCQCQDGLCTAAAQIPCGVTDRTCKE